MNNMKEEKNPMVQDDFQAPNANVLSQGFLGLFPRGVCNARWISQLFPFLFYEL